MTKRQIRRAANWLSIYAEVTHKMATEPGASDAEDLNREADELDALSKALYAMAREPKQLRM